MRDVRTVFAQICEARTGSARRKHRPGCAYKSRAAIVLTLLAAYGCGALPRDPEGTLNRIEHQHHLRIGLVENPPWVIRSAGEPLGIEPQMVRDLAASLGASPQWHWGSEQEHMEALDAYELDLVIGGIESSTPWSKKVGLTRPYLQEQDAPGAESRKKRTRSHVIATPPGENAWLKRLQEFLKQENGRTRELLQQMGAKP